MTSSTHELSFREDGDKGETTSITSLESQSQYDLLGRFDRLRETTQDNDKSTATVDTSAQNTVVISRARGALEESALSSPWPPGDRHHQDVSMSNSGLQPRDSVSQQGSVAPRYAYKTRSFAATTPRSQGPHENPSDQRTPSASNTARSVRPDGIAPRTLTTALSTLAEKDPAIYTSDESANPFIPTHRLNYSFELPSSRTKPTRLTQRSESIHPSAFSDSHYSAPTTTHDSTMTSSVPMDVNTTVVDESCGTQPTSDANTTSCTLTTAPSSDQSNTLSNTRSSVPSKRSTQSSRYADSNLPSEIPRGSVTFTFPTRARYGTTDTSPASSAATVVQNVFRPRAQSTALLGPQISAQSSAIKDFIKGPHPFPATSRSLNPFMEEDIYLVPTSTGNVFLTGPTNPPPRPPIATRPPTVADTEQTHLHVGYDSSKESSTFSRKTRQPDTSQNVQCAAQNDSSGYPNLSKSTTQSTLFTHSADLASERTGSSSRLAYSAAPRTRPPTNSVLLTERERHAIPQLHIPHGYKREYIAIESPSDVHQPPTQLTQPVPPVYHPMHSYVPLSQLTDTNLQAEQEEQQFTKTITDLWDAPNDPYSTYVGQRVPEIPFSYQTQRADTSKEVPPTCRQTQRVRSHPPTSRSRSLSPQQHSEPPSPSSSSTSSSPIKGNHFRRAEYRDPTPPRGDKPPSILKRPNTHKARLERPGESSVDSLSAQHARSVKFADSPTIVEQIAPPAPLLPPASAPSTPMLIDTPVLYPTYQPYHIPQSAPHSNVHMEMPKYPHELSKQGLRLFIKRFELWAATKRMDEQAAKLAFPLAFNNMTAQEYFIRT
jgi:hypothetical protein